MSDEKRTEREPRDWRLLRTIVLSLLRTFAACLLIILGSLVSMAAPETRETLAVTILGLLIFWTTVFVFYLRWQVRGISGSPIPLLRGLEAVFVGLVLFVSIFAKAYLMISHAQSSAFTEPLDGFSAYYYAVTVLSTVGFGDITPVGVLSRSVTMTQMVLDLAILAVTARVIFSEVQAARKRRGAPPVEPQDGAA